LHPSRDVAPARSVCGASPSRPAGSLQREEPVMAGEWPSSRAAASVKLTGFAVMAKRLVRVGAASSGTRDPFVGIRGIRACSGLRGPMGSEPVLGRDGSG
jgi:hypothetical protein